MSPEAPEAMATPAAVRLAEGIVPVDASCAVDLPVSLKSD